MRTTLEIMIAVAECQPATEEELRLALHALGQIEQTEWRMLHELVEDIRNKKPLPVIEMKAHLHLGTIEILFNAKKKPPKEWLGPNHTPGTPEQQAGLAMGKKIFKKATGLDL